MYRHRQLHLWITDHDYSLLRGLAEERKETMSAVIRNLIKLHQPEPGFVEAVAGEASAFFPPPLT